MSHYHRWFVPGGTYFFTVVTYNRYPFFKDQSARELLREVWNLTNEKLPFNNIASVLLHDHFHCLWTLPDGDFDYSTRLKIIKSYFTERWLARDGHEVMRSKSQSQRGNRGVWQRRFWEHVIRNEDDLANHFDYIHYNPVKHGYVKQTCHWPHSTFHRYVKSGHYDLNWGSSCPEAITNWNLE